MVWNLMERKSKPHYYDRVGLFRMDVLYTGPIDIMSAGDAIVPDFLKSGGMNDRMFFGLFEYARVWATGRFGLVGTYLNYLHKRNEPIELHSESFMKFLMRGINVKEENICFKRVRATGEIMNTDCKGSGFFRPVIYKYK